MALRRLQKEHSKLSSEIEDLNQRWFQSNNQTKISIGGTVGVALAALLFPLGALGVLGSLLSGKYLSLDMVLGAIFILIGGGSIFTLFLENKEREEARQTLAFVEAKLKDALARRTRLEQEIAKNRAIANS